MPVAVAMLIMAAAAGGVQVYQANKATKARNQARRVQAQDQKDERTMEVGAAQQMQTTALTQATNRNRKVRSQGLASNGMQAPAPAQDTNGFNYADNAPSLSGTF